MIEVIAYGDVNLWSCTNCNEAFQHAITTCKNCGTGTRITRPSATNTRKRSKQPSQHSQVDGIAFDSSTEMSRYVLLRNAQRKGVISGLECHPKFVLIEGMTYEPSLYTEPIRIQPMTYTADFRYTYQTHVIIEDVKAYAKNKKRPLVTRPARLRHKMLMSQNPDVTFFVTTSHDGWWRKWQSPSRWSQCFIQLKTMEAT